jgi:hypothetical protein
MLFDTLSILTTESVAEFDTIASLRPTTIKKGRLAAV